MKFEERQKREVYEDGYTICRGLASRSQVEAARKAINYSLGEGIDLANLPTMRAQSYCPELKSDPVIMALFHETGIGMLAESVLGHDSFDAPTFAQIALRFPRLDSEVPPFRPHLDGFPTPTNGVPPGTVGSFTALVGVLLSDLPEPNSGNFTVLPGTHRSTEKYFREHGPMAFLDGFPKIEQPEPIQITGQAGDIVFCHYQLGHGVAANISPNIRYALFFRISHRDHGDDKIARLADIWRDWPGIRAFAS